MQKKNKKKIYMETQIDMFCQKSDILIMSDVWQNLSMWFFKLYVCVYIYIYIYVCVCVCVCVCYAIWSYFRVILNSVIIVIQDMVSTALVIEKLNLTFNKIP